MIRLTGATVHKFKSIETDQKFNIEDDVTVLVGMNESGKTSILQALAKTNYFAPDKEFRFNTTHDYPRREKKQMEKAGKNPAAVTCNYLISDELLDVIKDDLGKGVFTLKKISITTKYNNVDTHNDISADTEKFVEYKMTSLGLQGKALKDKILKISNLAELREINESYQDPSIKSALKKFEVYYENKWEWGNPIEEYIARKHLKPNFPKFLYYDEYYVLPSRISIEKLNADSLETEDLKTAKALFELAEINVDELLNSDDFEDFKAELEATEATITDELFEYWSTNKNLEIVFEIDKKVSSDSGQPKIVEHILDIRVRNRRAKVSLPLRNRSKGFNWFFSFLVWFKKIQEDKNSNYVLLLDEPGLNLHASAQADLLNFVEDLSENYQVIYTTHSPFMVDSEKLQRVRTVLETEEGSKVSDTLQEKDPKTLFPLQAALGYDIAQNLFVSNKNLLVEGVSDLIYLQAFSGLLEGLGKKHLRQDITIVPVGGLEKVSTFVSLLRGSKLNIACLLDTAIDQSSRANLDKLISQKIIQKSKILHYDEFVSDLKEADIEDLLTKDEYLKLFNAAFTEHSDISVADLDSRIERIVIQLNKHLGKTRYNHYRPANELLKQSMDSKTFSKDTLDRFEKLFSKVNELL